MKELVEVIAKAQVDNPDEVMVTEYENDDELVIGDDGKALFRVHGGKLAVWVKK